MALIMLFYILVKFHNIVYGFKKMLLWLKIRPFLGRGQGDRLSRTAKVFKWTLNLCYAVVYVAAGGVLNNSLGKDLVF